MKFFSISFSIFILLMNFSARAAYQGELYGSSQTEREVRWIWRHLGDFVWSCSASKTECQTPEIKSLVTQLQSYVPKDNYEDFTRWDAMLKFVSEKEQPNLFQTQPGEIHRVAVTELKKYSVVYVNTDRMNLPFETWIAILSHEIVHHLGIMDDDKRLPDQFGSEIQKHVKAQLQISSLEQFKLPNAKYFTFNSLAPGKSSSTLLSDVEHSSDMGWAPNSINPICNADEQLFSQFITSPAWRVNRFQSSIGVVGIRGAGSMQAVCQKKNQTTQRFISQTLNAIVYLQYAVPFRFENWMQEIPKRNYNQDEYTFVPTDDYQFFGPLQTSYVLSITHEKLKFAAGEKWKTRIILQGTDEFTPLHCDLYVAGTQYSYITRDGLPGVNQFDSCAFTRLENNQWQIDGTTMLPANARADHYYVAGIALTNQTSGRMAVPTFPMYVEVINPKAPLAPVIEKISINGLPSIATQAKMLPNQNLKNSFLIKPNQQFEISFQVKGSQKIDDLWFDLTIWIALPGQDSFLPMKGTGSSSSFPLLLKKETIIPNAAGTEVRWTMTMPGNMSGYPIAAIKFARVYMRTSDFSWVEIYLPEMTDSMVVNEAYAVQ